MIIGPAKVASKIEARIGYMASACGWTWCGTLRWYSMGTLRHPFHSLAPQFFYSPPAFHHSGPQESATFLPNDNWTSKSHGIGMWVDLMLDPTLVLYGHSKAPLSHSSAPVLLLYLPELFTILGPKNQPRFSQMIIGPAKVMALACGWTWCWTLHWYSMGTLRPPFTL